MIRGYLRGVHPHDMFCPAETVLRDHDFHIYEIGVSGNPQPSEKPIRVECPVIVDIQ